MEYHTSNNPFYEDKLGGRILSLYLKFMQLDLHSLWSRSVVIYKYQAIEELGLIIIVSYYYWEVFISGGLSKVLIKIGLSKVLLLYYISFVKLKFT